MSLKEKYIPRQNEDLNRLVVITGVSASGKNYLLERLTTQGITSDSIKVVNFGEELLNYLLGGHLDVHSRDDIKKLPQEIITASILAVTSKLVEAQPAVINTHIVYRQNGSITTTPDVDLRLKPITYMYIAAPPDEIVERRATDTKRKRTLETVEQINLHQNISIEVVGALANHIGSRLVTICNREDNVQENLLKIDEVIEELRSYALFNKIITQH